MQEVKPKAEREMGTQAMSAADRWTSVRLASASIADAVGLFMRTDPYKHYSIADLEWLLFPALLLNQVQFAFARTVPRKDGDQNGTADEQRAVPVAVAMVTWAMVSEQVKQKLDTQKKAGQVARLAPPEWRSGKTPYIMTGVGAAEPLRELLTRVKTSLQPTSEVEAGQ